MAGLLGKAALAAATYTVVATNGANAQTVNIRMINRDQINSITVRLAICPSGYVNGAPSNADYIEPPDLVIPAGGILEETAIVLDPQEKVVAFSSAATATIRVHGH